MFFLLGETNMKKAIGVFFVIISLCWSFLLPVYAQEAATTAMIGLNEETRPAGDAVLTATEAKKEDAPDPNVIEVDVRIDAANYKAMVSSEQKKQYTVSVSADRSAYETAKINIRGNSSRQFGLAHPAKRIPFEIKFYTARPFGGFENKSVKFINCFYPYRLIAEYLALELFSFAGIPTPVHSFAFVRFNDVDFGLYIAVEDINKPFLSKWYAEPLQAAYKSTINEEKASEYIDSEWFGHLFEKVSGNSAHLSALTEALEKGEGYEQYINLDEWLRFFACIAVTGGDGSMLTEQNNFVLYDNNGKFDLIPWDLSEAFSGRKAPDSIDHYYVWHNESTPNPLFELLMSHQAYRDQYRAYIREFTEGFLQPSAIQARYDAILDALAPYLPKDHSILLNSEETLAELRSESPDTFSNLRYMLNASYQNLNAQLEGHEDTFAVNERFADYYENGDSYEYIISECEPLSPLLDTTLPQQIVKQGKAMDKDAQLRRYWVIGLGTAVALIVIAAGVSALKKKKREQGIVLSAKTILRGFGGMFSRHKVMFCFFVFIILYECIFAWQFGKWTIGEYAYIYHAMDYSFGFVTRVLPGAVSHFLFGEVTVLKATVFETVLLLLFFGCLSWFLEKLYYRLEAKDRPYGLLLMSLFVTGPCSFGIYVKELGMLDAWWLYTAVVILFLLSKKKLWPLIVVFAFVMVLTYFASVLCFAPFIVIILLYKATLEEDPKDRRLLYIVAGAFACVAIGFTVYFISSGAGNVKLAPEEFFALLDARGCTGDVEEVYGVMYDIPPEESGIAFGTNAEMLSQAGVKSELMAQIVIRLRQHLTIFAESTKAKYIQILYAFLLICPVLALLFSTFRYKLKSSRKLIQKFPFFCMLMLFFFINVVCLFVSTDTIKWLAHSFTLTFACFLIVLYHEPQMFAEKIKPLLQKIPLPVWVCYCLIYAAMVFAPYS